MKVKANSEIKISLPQEFPEDIKVRLTSDFRYEVRYRNSLLKIASSPKELREILINLRKFDEILEKDSFFEIFPDYLYPYFFLGKASPEYTLAPYFDVAKTKSGVTFYCFRVGSYLIFFTKDRIQEAILYLVNNSYDPEEVLSEYIKAVRDSDAPEDFKNAFLAVASLIKL